MSSRRPLEVELATTLRTTPANDYEPGVTRRDPSPVIKVGSLYYVWYTRATEGPSGRYGSVWFAASGDGRAWTEQGQAIGKGGSGAFDENGVFTPTTLIAEGRIHASTAPGATVL